VGLTIPTVVLVLGAGLVWLGARPERTPDEAAAARAPASRGPATDTHVHPPVTAARADLALLSTSVSDAPERSTATLLDRASGAMEIARPGAALHADPEILVVSIEVRRVELTRNGRSWILELTGGARPPMPDVSDLAQILGAPGLGVDERAERLLSAAAGRRVPGNVFGEAAFAPYFDDDGALAGLYLSAVRRAGLYARLGLGEGDVLREVNGIRIDGPDALREAAQILAVEPSLHLVVESGGEIRRVLVDLEPGDPVPSS
jgi:hypothetical protein